MFMGFILHIYIIFWTNLLTGGPHPYCCFFCLFQYFEEKEYQTESKRNETFGSVIFGTNVIQRTWSGRQASNKEATRQGGAPRGVGVPPASWTPRPFLDVDSKSSGSRLFQKSRSRRFHSVWTPFDIPFLRNTEIGKTNNNTGWASVSRLVPKMI